ncbi:hypothetical protein RF11_03874 [Thelohanellus kitauei]|uniref:MULE transposase domain-containing protein n=1 Tax=Thelohanellus kitauei TaxID=669202 RepID=A0A0C2MRV6_THEKT|nr:hypothetical protein RF11_03874 [Thelohanellus kitauei]
MNYDKTEIILPPTDHTHAPNTNEIEARKIMNNMRYKALNTTLNPRSIISSSQIAVTPAVSSLLPDYDTLRRNIQNIRRNLIFPEILPASASELVIPNEYQMTEAGDRFLFFDDSSIQNNRVIIFMSDSCSDILSTSKHIYFDGTFKTIPNIFYQMFSIHASKHDSIVPCAYILMEKKNLEAYRLAWNCLLPFISHELETTMCDFEKASISAFIGIFPNCNVTGYFFHLKQCIWRKIQSIGLVDMYRS